MISNSIAAEIFDEDKSADDQHLKSFSYGENTIRYQVIRKQSQRDGSKQHARKIIIKVHPDLRVVANAPFDATDEAIHEAILKRARWIWQSLEEFEKQRDAVLSKSYVSGEPQFYLGKRYVLKILVNADEIPNVKLIRGKLVVTIRSKTEDSKVTIKALLDRWYLLKAKAVFHERLAELLPQATWVKGIPSFRVMAMQKQWGSCSTKGNLMLNPHLIKAPKECIDYVILHELCHIAEHNHSDRFWRLLTQLMPNCKDVKSKLDGMAEMYLNE